MKHVVELLQQNDCLLLPNYCPAHIYGDRRKYRGAFHFFTNKITVESHRSTSAGYGPTGEKEIARNIFFYEIARQESVVHPFSFEFHNRVGYPTSAHLYFFRCCFGF